MLRVHHYGLKSWVPLICDPQVSGRWVANITLFTRLITLLSASSATSALLTRINSAASAAQAAARLAAEQKLSHQGVVPERQQQYLIPDVPAPPSAESSTVRCALRRCLPSALHKVSNTFALNFRLHVAC
jgi:hypothetical protein